MPMTTTLAVTDAQRTRARAVEEEVFGRWFDNTGEELAEEYGPYEDASVFFLAHPVGDPDDVVGVSRLIAPGLAGNKTLADVARSPWHADGLELARRAGMDPDRIWDVATVCATPRGQGAGAAPALYAGMFEHLTGQGAGWWTSLIDEVVLKLARNAGLPCQPLPTLSAGPYLGSPATVPVYGAVADIRLVG